MWLLGVQLEASNLLSHHLHLHHDLDLDIDLDLYLNHYLQLHLDIAIDLHLLIGGEQLSFSSLFSSLRPMSRLDLLKRVF